MYVYVLQAMPLDKKLDTNSFLKASEATIADFQGFENPTASPEPQGKSALFQWALSYFGIRRLEYGVECWDVVRLLAT